ncbi:MAG: glycosyltransferase [bacterium]
MRIAVVNNLFKPWTRGGAEQVAQFQVKALKKLAHDVIVITSLVDSKTTFQDEFPVYRLSGFPSTFSRLSLMPLWLRYLWHLINLFNFVTPYRIYRILKKEKIDLVVGNNIFGLGLLTPIACRLADAKYVAVLHDIQLLHPSGLMYYGQEFILESPAAKIYQFFTGFFFAFCSGVTAPSHWLIKLHQAHFMFVATSAVVIKNPDIDAVNVKRVEPQKFTMLFAAQLEVHKGIKVLLEAVSGLAGDWVLQVMGDGSLEADVVQAALRDERIKYQKWSESDLPDLLANASCLISPSLCYENSPLAIRRAQLAGLPVIASNLGGTPELFSETKFLFRPTVESLRDKLIECQQADFFSQKNTPINHYDDYITDLLLLALKNDG